MANKKNREKSTKKNFEKQNEPNTPVDPCSFFISASPSKLNIIAESFSSVGAAGDLPTAQRLMSGPSSMPSGQAQVYLGEWSVICGAFRHRYSQPPLGRLPMLHVSGALGREEHVFRIMKISNTIKRFLITMFLLDIWGTMFPKIKLTGDQVDMGEQASSLD